MTNAEIIATLHRMVDRLDPLLNNPPLGLICLPTLRLTFKPDDDDGEVLQLTVGAEYLDPEKAP